jgi:hypothetical protein
MRPPGLNENPTDDSGNSGGGAINILEARQSIVIGTWTQPTLQHNDNMLTPTENLPEVKAQIKDEGRDSRLSFHQFVEHKMHHASRIQRCGN